MAILNFNRNEGKHTISPEAFIIKMYVPDFDFAVPLVDTKGVVLASG